MNGRTAVIRAAIASIKALISNIYVLLGSAENGRCVPLTTRMIMRTSGSHDGELSHGNYQPGQTSF